MRCTLASAADAVYRSAMEEADRLEAGPDVKQTESDPSPSERPKSGRGSGWNVVVVAGDNRFDGACRLLARFGSPKRTGFYNVLTLKVPDARAFLDDFAQAAAASADLAQSVSRLVPAEHTFTFNSPEEFEAKAREIALTWVEQLAGKAFHVRLHRRGFKGRLRSPEEERFLDRVLLEALEVAGASGSITFEDPDAVIDVETVGSRAGMSLWTRDDLRRYPFLRLTS